MEQTEFADKPENFRLDEKTIEIVGLSLARQFTEKLGRTPRFITGRDTRESGEWIEKAFHNGAKTRRRRLRISRSYHHTGRCFFNKKFDFDAGIVISASHNPFDDNGIKIFSPTGKKLDDETERQIEKDIFEKLSSR